MSIRDEIVSRISSFPTIPLMVNRLLRMLDDSDTSFSRIADVIKYDPALTANVLKAANSSYLGFSGKVSSITEATVRLGTKWMYKIAISSLIESHLRRPAAGYDITSEQLWKHSMAAALIAENLSKKLKIKDYAYASWDWMNFTAALLHDMGKIILGNFISDRFDEILRTAEEEKIPFEAAEKRILGIDHAEVGALIAENWSFPAEMADCIRWHHNPDGAGEATPSMDVVHIADAISMMHGFGVGKDGLQYHPSTNSIKRLGISGSDLELVSAQIISSLEDVENMFTEENIAEDPVGRW